MPRMTITNLSILQLVQEADKAHVHRLDYCAKHDYYIVRYTDEKDREHEARIGTEHPGDDLRFESNDIIKENINA